jgi:hypothetical protein
LEGLDQDDGNLRPAWKIFLETPISKITTAKCHKETSFIAILNKQKCHFFLSLTKLENRRAQQILCRERMVPVWEKGVGG